jgi:Holliday junction resolvase RusA-like endonuclease
MSQLRSEHKFPLQKAAVAIRFFGNHRTNSDLDNMAGACLDALTLNGAGVLMDDRLSCLPRLTVEYVSGTEETGIWIEIQPL